MTLAFALVVAQGIHLYRGEAQEAVSMGDEIVALSREYELKQETEWGRSFQGAALAALGRTTEGIDQLKDSLAVQQAIGSGLVRTAFLALLAEMLAGAGRIDEGLQAVDEGFVHAEADARRRVSRRAAPDAWRAAARSPETCRPPKTSLAPGDRARARAAGEVLRIARGDGPCEAAD